MTESDIYKRAAKLKLRFDTDRGELTTEQLFELPLVGLPSKPGLQAANLDAIARSVSKQLKDLTDESFVELKPDPRRGLLELKLEILKDVIADKLAARVAAEKRTENAEKRRKIIDALATRESQDLAGKSKEELMKELEAIGD